MQRAENENHFFTKGMKNDVFSFVFFLNSLTLVVLMDFSVHSDLSSEVFK